MSGADRPTSFGTEIRVHLAAAHVAEALSELVHEAEVVTHAGIRDEDPLFAALEDAEPTLKSLSALIEGGVKPVTAAGLGLGC